MGNISVEVLVASGAGLDLVEAARQAALLTLESQGQTGVKLGIALAGDDYLQALNRRYRGKDAPTDVLSFPLREAGDSDEVPLGDVIVSVPQGQSNAEKRGHSLETEVIYLVAHGVLHLLGWCDDSAAEEEHMWEIQEKVATEYQRRR